MVFDYEELTLEQIDRYKTLDFICDGDNKTIFTILKEDLLCDMQPKRNFKK